MDESTKAIAQDVLPVFISFNCVCLFLSICCVFVCLFVVFVCLYEYMNKNPYRAKNKDNWEPSHESAIPGRKIINQI